MGKPDESSFCCETSTSSQGLPFIACPMRVVSPAIWRGLVDPFHGKESGGQHESKRLIAGPGIRPLLPVQAICVGMIRRSPPYTISYIES